MADSTSFATICVSEISGLCAYCGTRTCTPFVDHVLQPREQGRHSDRMPHGRSFPRPRLSRNDCHGLVQNTAFAMTSVVPVVVVAAVSASVAPVGPSMGVWISLARVQGQLIVLYPVLLLFQARASCCQQQCCLCCCRPFCGCCCSFCSDGYRCSSGSGCFWSLKGRFLICCSCFGLCGCTIGCCTRFCRRCWH